MSLPDLSHWRPLATQGFTISVFNRSYEKTEAAERRAKKEGEQQGHYQYLAYELEELSATEHLSLWM